MTNHPGTLTGPRPHTPTDNTATRSTAVTVTLTRSLKASAVGVACVTFILSFYGLNDFAHTSMKLPSVLSWIVPIGLDGLTLTAIAATFELRNAVWRVRAYAWLVFAVAAGLSMAGNHQHAVSKKLDDAGTTGFTVAPVILALAAHLVVVTWRNLERPRTAIAAPVTVTPTTTVSAGALDTAPAVKPQPHRDTAPRKRLAVVGGRGDKKARALELRDSGMTVLQVAAEMNVSERTAFRYLGSDTPGTPAGADNSGDPAESAGPDRAQEA